MLYVECFLTGNYAQRLDENMILAIYGYYLLLLISSVKSEEFCPIGCQCKTSAGDLPYDEILKIRCGDHIKHIDEISFGITAKTVVHLNLSSNLITNAGSQFEFPALQKLDLSKNNISVISVDTFRAYPNLRRLDLSSNILKHVDSDSFKDIPKLERLKLNQNELTIFSKGTFELLTNLRQLDISANPLSCDCELLWLLEWIQVTSVKIVSNPKCSSPPALKDQLLRKVRIGVDVHCGPPISLKDPFAIEIKPDRDQVVFEGDSLKLNCKVPSYHLGSQEALDSFNERSQITWLWLNEDPKQYFSNVVVESRYMAESGFIDSSVRIKQLHRNHSGEWYCYLRSDQGNQSRAIQVVVISEDTKYCPPTVTRNNKGMYMWPKTVVNFTVELPCEDAQFNERYLHSKATHFCSSQGVWETLNTSFCPFTSETTKVLEQFAHVNLTVTKGNIFESAVHLKNYTSNTRGLQDPIDVVFITRTVENYLGYLSNEKDLGFILADVIGQVMELPKELIIEADEQERVCSRLVAALEIIADHSPPINAFKSNIAMEQFRVKKDSFSGMTCTWYSNPSNPPDRLFHCATTNRSRTSSSKDRIVEASIQVPTSFFNLLQQQGKFIASQRLLVTMFSSNKLFPVMRKMADYNDITTDVVGVKLGEELIGTLSEPIHIMLRPSLRAEDNPPTPVWWDPYLNNGAGSWSTRACQTSHLDREVVVFSCNRLGYYGIMQDTIQYFSDVIMRGAKFRYAHPGIYVGSFILISSLLVTIVTYVMCFTSLQMAKKIKHSLINTWLAILLLCFMYTFGMYQTEDFRICQIVGLTIHYFTVAFLLWMCVSMKTLHERLAKAESSVLSDDDLPADPPVQKPIFGLYLVGWGIALIVCGISGAVNMKEYSSYSYCFLVTLPSLSAVILPSGILFLVLLWFASKLCYIMRKADTQGQLSEGTQATENVDLDLLDPQLPTMSVRSDSTLSSEIEDPEHAPSTQLNAHLIVFVLSVALWSAGAMAATHTVHNIADGELIFSVAYAVAAVLLGCFIVFFYCIARNDVRSKWAAFYVYVKRRRTRGVSDTTRPPVSHMAVAAPSPEVRVSPRPSSQNSTRTKSGSQNININIIKAAVDLNSSFQTVSPKPSNINIVLLHRQQFRSNNSEPTYVEPNEVEMYYNPHQIGVARKFFRRQKRHTLRCNNLGRPSETDCTSEAGAAASPLRKTSNLDRNIIGSGSKINNTNINVEHVKELRKHSPTVLSHSCDESELLIDKLHRVNAMGSDLDDDLVKEEIMRTVSQQCSLEYSTSEADFSCDKPPSRTVSPKGVDNGRDVDISDIENSAAFQPVEVEQNGQRDVDWLGVNQLSTSSLEPVEKLYNSVVDDEDDQHHLHHPQQRRALNLQAEVEISDADDCCGSYEASSGLGRIYVNPGHEVHYPINRTSSQTSSLCSSVSVTELDELYQQITRGPNYAKRPKRYSKRSKAAADSIPASFSDSETITSRLMDGRSCRKQRHKSGSNGSGDSRKKRETRV